jgi:hypothetical protein
LAIDVFPSANSHGWLGVALDLVTKAIVSITQPANRSGHTGRRHHR